jgi:glucokinase
MNGQDRRRILAGDIGGTKTILGLFMRGDKRPRAEHVETYPSLNFPDLESIVKRFVDRYPVEVVSACFGIAGPVTDGRCRATNLPWEVSETSLAECFGWTRVKLINDLVALTHSIPWLEESEVLSLNQAKPRTGGPMALLAPGTGLGQALLIDQEGHYIPIASEGGHVDFAPRDDAEIELWRYLHRQFGHVSLERVLSGPGIVNLYTWVKDSGRYAESVGILKGSDGPDLAPAISEAALQGSDPLCVEALNRFVSILGAAAGNLALIALTTGGVFLGGGIPPKILPKLKERIFWEAFTDKGRFRELLEGIPVWVILNSEAALAGAAIHAAAIHAAAIHALEVEHR